MGQKPSICADINADEQKILKKGEVDEYALARGSTDNPFLHLPQLPAIAAGSQIKLPTYDSEVIDFEADQYFPIIHSSIKDTSPQVQPLDVNINIEAAPDQYYSILRSSATDTSPQVQPLKKDGNRTSSLTNASFVMTLPSTDESKLNQSRTNVSFPAPPQSVGLFPSPPHEAPSNVPMQNLSRLSSGSSHPAFGSSNENVLASTIFDSNSGSDGAPITPTRPHPSVQLFGQRPQLSLSVPTFGLKSTGAMSNHPSLIDPKGFSGSSTGPVSNNHSSIMEPKGLSGSYRSLSDEPTTSSNGDSRSIMMESPQTRLSCENGSSQGDYQNNRGSSTEQRFGMKAHSEMYRNVLNNPSSFAMTTQTDIQRRFTSPTIRRQESAPITFHNSKPHTQSLGTRTKCENLPMRGQYFSSRLVLDEIPTFRTSPRPLLQQQTQQMNITSHRTLTPQQGDITPIEEASLTPQQGDITPIGSDASFLYYIPYEEYGIAPIQRSKKRSNSFHGTSHPRVLNSSHISAETCPQPIQMESESWWMPKKKTVQAVDLKKGFRKPQPLLGETIQKMQNNEISCSSQPRRSPNKPLTSIPSPKMYSRDGLSGSFDASMFDESQEIDEIKISDERVPRVSKKPRSLSPSRTRPRVSNLLRIKAKSVHDLNQQFLKEDKVNLDIDHTLEHMDRFESEALPKMYFQSMNETAIDEEDYFFREHASVMEL